MSKDQYVANPKLLRATQLRAVADAYVRFWCSGTSDERISEIERLLDKLLEAANPIKIPSWVTSDREPVPAWLSEFFTRVLLIDPILEALGWSSPLLSCEETFLDCRDGKKKRVDYALRLRHSTYQFRLVALIEAKREELPPEHGLEQAKAYAAGRCEPIPFVFSTNGRHYVQYDRRTKIPSKPCSLEQFPTPEDLAELLTAR
jgi:hypothetical protein